jgi:hypothetical protein
VGTAGARVDLAASPTNSGPLVRHIPVELWRLGRERE